MSIRAAVLADVPQLVAMGRAFLQTPPYAGVFADAPDVLAHLVTSLIESASSAVLVTTDGETLTGMIAVIAAPHFLSGELTAGEVFYFVDPDARGTAGVRLLKAAEAWARSIGAKSLQMVAPEGAARVEAFYTALHYVPVERSYLRDL